MGEPLQSNRFQSHYHDVMMTTMASQITSLTVVYSTVYSDAYQRKHQSSASLVFVWGIHRDRWIPRTKSQLRGKCFYLMTSSWYARLSYVIDFYVGSIDCDADSFVIVLTQFIQSRLYFAIHNDYKRHGICNKRLLQILSNFSFVLFAH